MSISIQQERATETDVVVLHVAGYVDADTFERLEQCIFSSFDKGSYKILINLAQVKYMSSAGAGVFINACSEARENHGNVVILNPSERVRDIIELLGLENVLETSDNREMALERF